MWGHRTRIPLALRSRVADEYNRAPTRTAGLHGRYAPAVGLASYNTQVTARHPSTSAGQRHAQHDITPGRPPPAPGGIVRIPYARCRPHRFYDSGRSTTSPQAPRPPGPQAAPHPHQALWYGYARCRPHRLYDSGMHITPDHDPSTQLKQESRAKPRATAARATTLRLV